MGLEGVELVLLPPASSSSQGRRNLAPRRTVPIVSTSNKVARWIALSALPSLLLVMAGAACELDISLGRHDRDDSSPTVGLEDDGSWPDAYQGLGEFDGGEICAPGPHDDADGDGFTIAQGDCNDCVAAVSPNSIEVLSPAGADEDCDGAIDEIDAACDADLVLDDSDPLMAARAIELCRTATDTQWGLVEAKWVLPDGSSPPAKQLDAYHLGHGILDGFGSAVSPRRGTRMLALSSGAARRPHDEGHREASGYDKGYGSDHPQGFPKEFPGCDAITGEPRDGVGLEVVLRAPANARGIAFDFKFYTYEWPQSVCTESNDFFVALMDPPPLNQVDGNISFDSQGNPVSVNNAFLDVCACDGASQGPCEAGGKVFECAMGDAELFGTGYGPDTEPEGHAATSWLVTEAPAAPSETVSIRFAIYDSKNGEFDSLTLVDNVRWLARSAYGTSRVPK